MIDLKLYSAIVVDTNDTDQKGKIKIRPLPELRDALDSSLPWALPFLSNEAGGSYENDLPEKDSLIYVLIDDTWQRFYYLKNMFFEDIFDFTKVTTSLSSASEISDKTYSNIKFKLYEDGGLDFHNRQTGEHGFIHKNGSYSIFDAVGNCIVNTGINAITIKGGSITINGGNVKITGGVLTVDGSVAPTGMGGFCGLPYCLMTGAPQTGTTILGT